MGQKIRSSAFTSWYSDLEIKEAMAAQKLLEAVISLLNCSVSLTCVPVCIATVLFCKANQCNSQSQLDNEVMHRRLDKHN